MILYYDILSPSPCLGIGGKDPIQTPDGVFYSFAVRDHVLDAINLCNRLNKSGAGYRVAAHNQNGFEKWIAA